MAGGMGERMRASGIDVPKPLVRVRGATLLERSLFSVLRAGVAQIAVSVSAHAPGVASLALDRGGALARAVGGRLWVLEERTPLGNIGVAGRLRDLADAVLVVYADNLTTLDLRALRAANEARGASMTLAVHRETVRMPYGELMIHGNDVVDYREKPERTVLICSGIAVLGPAALACLPDDRPTGLTDLFHTLRAHGEVVAAFPHEAPWIDVNDRAAVDEAERLVRSHPEAFERWLEPPIPERTWGLALRPGRVLVSQADAVPVLPPQPHPVLRADATGPIAEFDDLDGGAPRLVRHRVFAADAPEALPAGLAWVSRQSLMGSDHVDPVLRRALAAAAPDAS
jgi:NDP-sugar pyrophosphorylase family protein